MLPNDSGMFVFQLFNNLLTFFSALFAFYLINRIYNKSNDSYEERKKRIEEKKKIIIKALNKEAARRGCGCGEKPPEDKDDKDTWKKWFKKAAYYTGVAAVVGISGYFAYCLLFEFFGSGMEVFNIYTQKSYLYSVTDFSGWIYGHQSWIQPGIGISPQKLPPVVNLLDHSSFASQYNFRKVTSFLVQIENVLLCSGVKLNLQGIGSVDETESLLSVRQINNLVSLYKEVAMGANIFDRYNILENILKNNENLRVFEDGWLSGRFSESLYHFEVYMKNYAEQINQAK